MCFFCRAKCADVLTADTSNFNSWKFTSRRAQLEVSNGERTKRRKKLNKLIAVRRELADKRIYSELGSRKRFGPERNASTNLLPQSETCSFRVRLFLFGVRVWVRLAPELNKPFPNIENRVNVPAVTMIRKKKQFRDWFNLAAVIWIIISEIFLHGKYLDLEIVCVLILFLFLLTPNKFLATFKTEFINFSLDAFEFCFLFFAFAFTIRWSW